MAREVSPIFLARTVRPSATLAATSARCTRYASSTVISGYCRDSWRIGCRERSAASRRRAASVTASSSSTLPPPRTGGHPVRSGSRIFIPNGPGRVPLVPLRALQVRRDLLGYRGVDRIGRIQRHPGHDVAVAAQQLRRDLPGLGGDRERVEHL